MLHKHRQILDDDEWDELDEWEDDDPEIACVDCGRPGLDCCQCCGGYLCGMHSEIGCGFCKACPTQGWIDEQDVLRKLDGYTPPRARAGGEEDAR